MLATLKLIQMFFSSALRRLRYDLIRELVVLFCAALLGATFYYIFNDFVNEQMGKLRPDLKSKTVMVLSWVLLLLITQWQANRVRLYVWSQKSLYRMSLRLGSTHSHARVFLIVTLGIFLLASSAFTWLFIQTSLNPRTHMEMVLTQSALYLYVLLSILIRSHSEDHAERKGKIQLASDRPILSTMRSWRFQQIIKRNLAARISLFFAVITTVLATLLTRTSAPEAALFMLLYLTGFFASLPIFFQLTADLKLAWAERTMGVSHELIVSVYRRLAYGLFFPLVIPFVIGYFINTPAERLDIFRLLQYIGVGITPVYLAPYLMFQIDAHRPSIQILTLFFTGLFIATAIFVHLLGLILLPGFSYYALASQAGRYYRV